MKKYFLFTLLFSASQILVSAQTSQLKIDYEKEVLTNGLTVLYHIDRSDPVVAVNLTAHVGSAREKEGRTGFAHLFEHLLFLESENLGKGGLDKLSARIGGSGANGSTSRDRTNYLQTVPKDALEKMIWAEADKLGWFINTVTDPVLAKEKQVVKNEKRQSVDNNAYGHESYVVSKALYPTHHPYNWEVIGSLEDLDNATLADVKEFYRKWYVPNNVTLVIAGDFDIAQAKNWVRKYFNEIPAGQKIEKLAKQPAQLSQVVKLYHEDNFARLAQLSYTWPGVEEFHPDSYALSILASYLAQGKKAPLYKVLVEDKKLTTSTSLYSSNSEVAGELNLTIRALPGKKLDEIAAAINEAFALFEKEGISDKDLERIKAGEERRFYNSLSSVLGKSSTLAHYSIFAGDPGFAAADIANTLKVTKEDVMRVYEKYIKNKAYVATSFVPKGATDLILTGSELANVVEEKIVAGAEEEFDAKTAATYEKTPSSFDRSIEPPYGEKPTITAPTVWQKNLKNGLRLYGIENNEVPLVQCNIIIDGGQLLETSDKVGVANLMASLMQQGTKYKTPQELEEAIDQLGSSIFISAGKEGITISGNSLARNYEATLQLIEEMILHPRWDEKEFELAKSRVLSSIKQQEANPNIIATNQFNEILYGKGHVYARNILGTQETVEGITIDDLKQFYKKAINPTVARMHIVGDLKKDKIVASLQSLDKNWKGAKMKLPKVSVQSQPTASKIYFFDVPDAKQSVLRIGGPALKETDANYYNAVIANYILGGGGFASRLTQELREGKGYTYGINSSFSGGKNTGMFSIGSGVRSNVTFESLQLIKEILENYGSTYTDADLETTKGYLIKSQARSFETAGAKLNMLSTLSNYNWKSDYIKKREKQVQGMTIPKIQEIAKKYLDANNMIWLVVGDAKTQLEKLKELGFGEPVLLNRKGF